jgi:hypothetical protein
VTGKCLSQNWFRDVQGRRPMLRGSVARRGASSPRGSNDWHISKDQKAPQGRPRFLHMLMIAKNNVPLQIE